MKFLFLTVLSLASAAWAADKTPSPSIEHGRYLVRVTNCNDCHTPMYMPTDGKVAEKDWMIGVPVGWMGPWGTTYAPNIRQRAAAMDEDTWVKYLKNLKTRPPMPYFAVNDFSELDSRSIYRFLRSLGDHPNQVPTALAPGVKPATPFFDFNLNMPKPAKVAGAAKR